MLKKIKVYGTLRKFLGQAEFEVDLNTPREAISFLVCNFKGIEKHMAEQLYTIQVGAKVITEDLLNFNNTIPKIGWVTSWSFNCGISGYSDSNSLSSFDLAIQDPTGGAATTLEIQFDGDMGATLPQAAIDALNAILEAGVADPYHIPKFADVAVPTEYLEAPTLYKITGVEIS
mgnify:CR=1 FL=1